MSTMSFASSKGEGPTVWIMSRIRFAVWNTVAARPIAPDAIPNVSAAIFGERKRVFVWRGSKVGWKQRGVQPPGQAGIEGAWDINISHPIGLTISCHVRNQAFR